MRTSTASSIHTPIFISSEEEEGANDVIAKGTAVQSCNEIQTCTRSAKDPTKLTLDLKHNSESEVVGLNWLDMFQTVRTIDYGKYFHTQAFFFLLGPVVSGKGGQSTCGSGLT